jgi:hypothetical protein
MSLDFPMILRKKHSKNVQEYMKACVSEVKKFGEAQA